MRWIRLSLNLSKCHIHSNSSYISLLYSISYKPYSLACILPFFHQYATEKEIGYGSHLDHYRLLILNRHRHQVYVSCIGAQSGRSHRRIRSYRGIGRDKLRACTTIHRTDVLMRAKWKRTNHIDSPRNSLPGLQGSAPTALSSSSWHSWDSMVVCIWIGSPIWHQTLHSWGLSSVLQ